MDRVAWSVRSLIIITVALQMVTLMEAAPLGALITSLPGQPEVSFKQYSGYITVDQSHGRKLFYYFVEAVNASATTPLVLWLNGGPGCSSLMGGFIELGPFYPNETGDGLIVNSNSWNQVANIIFLESPAGVGFSYSNDTSDYYTDDKKTAEDSLTFLLGWLQEYPEYNSTDFYITGESYAGHYIPQLATAILNNNKVSGQVQINLKGVMVGNPLFDPKIDYPSRITYAWGHGMISDATYEAIVQECNITLNPSAACNQTQMVAYNESGLTSLVLNQYDVTADQCVADEQALRLMAMSSLMDFTPDPCIIDEEKTYLNLAAVETALHTEVAGWSRCSTKLNYTQDDIHTPMAPVLENLLINSSLRVWVYSGDADIIYPMIGTRTIVNSIAQNLKMNVTSDYQMWYQDCQGFHFTTGDCNLMTLPFSIAAGVQIGGWTMSWDSLVFATVRAAGHMVPYYQPARSLGLFFAFIAGDSTPPILFPKSC